MHILYKSYMIPIKGQLPDVVYHYVEDDAQFPWDFTLTDNKYDARIFEKSEADYYADLLGFKVKEI